MDGPPYSDTQEPLRVMYRFATYASFLFGFGADMQYICIVCLAYCDID